MGQKNLSFSWQQDLPNPNDFAGWRVYSSTTAGGPYTLWDTIVFTTQQTQYTATRVFTSPDNQAVTYHFVMAAYDKNGNQSPYSNEADATIDFQPPSAPYSLTITVQAV